MSTETETGMLPEHSFEPDGFPTRIIFVMFGVFATALFGTIWVLVAYAENSSVIELSSENKAAEGSDLLRGSVAAGDAQLTRYGFVGCDTPGPEVTGPARDLQCLPTKATFHAPYGASLEEFLGEATTGNAVKPLADPPPLPDSAEPGADAGAAAPTGRAMPAGRVIPTRPAPKDGGSEAGEGGRPNLPKGVEARPVRRIPPPGNLRQPADPARRGVPTGGKPQPGGANAPN